MEETEPLRDRAILDGFRRGDRAALAAVYRAHAKDVGRAAALGFSFKAGADVHRFFGYRTPHEQQDAVQEVFVRAFSERGRQGFDGLSPFGAYLRGILKNLVIDDFRKKKAALEVFGGSFSEAGEEDVVDRAAAPVVAADVSLQRKQVGESVRGFLGTLNEREKRFVELRYTKGLGQEDVALRLKVGRSTVRTLEERVRDKLHERLAAEGLVEARPSVLARAKGWLMPAMLVAVGGSHV